MSRSRVVRLTALDVTRIVILPADWGDKDYNERVEWLIEGPGMVGPASS